MKPVVIDIGCGRNKLEGAIGIDSSPYADADVVLDLNVEPLPWPDSSVDFVHSSHALEHLRSDGFMNIVREMYRVCKPGGQIFLVLPYFHQTSNLANPFHNNNVCFDEHTFRFFSSAETCPALDPDDYATPSCPQWGLRYSATTESEIELQLDHLEFLYYPEFADRDPEDRRHARQHQLNVVEQIVYYLQPIKPAPRRLDDERSSKPDFHDFVERQVAYHRDQIAFVVANREEITQWSGSLAVGETTRAERVLNDAAAPDFRPPVRVDELYRDATHGRLRPPYDVVRSMNSRIQDFQWLTDEVLRARTPLSDPAP